MGEEPAKDTLKGQMVKGAAWMAGMRWSLKFIGLINTIILARLLAPEDFGIIAMAMVVIGFLEQMAELSVDQVLLRERNPDKYMYDSAWTIQLCLGIVLGVAVFAMAPQIANFYNDERVELVVQIIAGRAILSGFVNIGTVDFRKNLDFGKEFRFWVYSRLAQFVLTLGLVLYYRDYLAMAIAIPLAMAIKVVISYRMSAYRPSFSFRHVRPFWDFARWLIVTNVAQFVNKRGDEFVVGSSAPAQTVGAYYVASDISAMLTREILLPTGRAFLPIYSKLTHNPDELSATFRLVLCFAALIAFPIGFGASVVAEDFVLVVLGGQWRPMIPFFQWLAIFGALAGFVSVIRPMLIVQRHEKVSALMQVSQAVVTIPVLFYVASIASILDIAIARTLLMILFAAVYLWMSIQYCLQTFRSICSVLWRPLLASIAMAYVVNQIHHSVWENVYLSLAFDAGIGATVYLCCVLALWVLCGRPAGAEREVIQWLLTRIRFSQSRSQR